MKTRVGFVSNSSSSSYLIVGYDVSKHPELGDVEEVAEKIVKWTAEKYDWAENDWKFGEYPIWEDFSEMDGYHKGDFIGLSVAFTEHVEAVDMESVKDTCNSLEEQFGVEPSLILAHFAG